MQTWQLALVAPLSLSACDSKQPIETETADQALAKCQIDAARTYRNSVEDASNAKYVYLCMKAGGYELKTQNMACMDVKITKDATVEEGCYQKAQ